MGPPATLRPKAHVRSTQEKWTVSKWPTTSPDLSPIEHLWCELKSAIGEKKPANIQELEQFTKKEREKTPAETRKKRLEAAVTAKE